MKFLRNTDARLDEHDRLMELLSKRLDTVERVIGLLDDEPSPDDAEIPEPPAPVPDEKIEDVVMVSTEETVDLEAKETEKPKSRRTGRRKK